MTAGPGHIGVQLQGAPSGNYSIVQEKGLEPSQIKYEVKDAAGNVIETKLYDVTITIKTDRGLEKLPVNDYRVIQKYGKDGVQKIFRATIEVFEHKLDPEIQQRGGFTGFKYDRNKITYTLQNGTTQSVNIYRRQNSKLDNAVGDLWQHILNKEIEEAWGSKTKGLTQRQQLDKIVSAPLIQQHVRAGDEHLFNINDKTGEMKKKWLPDYASAKPEYENALNQQLSEDGYQKMKSELDRAKSQLEECDSKLKTTSKALQPSANFAATKKEVTDLIAAGKKAKTDGDVKKAKEHFEKVLNTPLSYADRTALDAEFNDLKTALNEMQNADKISLNNEIEKGKKFLPGNPAAARGVFQRILDKPRSQEELARCNAELNQVETFIHDIDKDNPGLKPTGAALPSAQAVIKNEQIKDKMAEGNKAKQAGDEALAKGQPDVAETLYNEAKAKFEEVKNYEMNYYEQKLHGGEIKNNQDNAMQKLDNYNKDVAKVNLNRVLDLCKGDPAANVNQVMKLVSQLRRNNLLTNDQNKELAKGLKEFIDKGNASGLAGKDLLDLQTCEKMLKGLEADVAPKPAPAAPTKTPLLQRIQDGAQAGFQKMRDGVNKPFYIKDLNAKMGIDDYRIKEAKLQKEYQDLQKIEGKPATDKPDGVKEPSPAEIKEMKDKYALAMDHKNNNRMYEAEKIFNEIYNKEYTYAEFQAYKTILDDVEFQLSEPEL